MKHLTRVGVLRGGPSSEYEISLKTGGNVLKVLRQKFGDKYQTHDILIDKEGNWHIDGMKTVPEKLSSQIDVAFNALHGSYGEDGKVQKILDMHGIKYTGSDSLSSAVGMNKVLSRKVFENHGLKIPIGKEVSSKEITSNVIEVARELFRSFPMPAVVKPASAGSSVGVSVAHTQKELIDALNKAFQHGPTVLIEEFIKGKEVTVGVIEGFRDQGLYVLPVVEVLTKSEGVVPARLAFKIKEELSDLARKAHQALGLRHYSRSDFIIHPKRGIFILETNTLPKLDEQSVFLKALDSVGSSPYFLVDNLIQAALGASKN